MQTLTVKLNTQGPPIVLWRAIPAALTITGVAAPAEHWDLIVTAGRTDSPLLTGTVTGTDTTLSASFPVMDSAALAAAIEGKATLACEVTLTDGAAQVYLFPLTVRNRATNTTPPAPVPPDAVRSVNGQPGPEVNLDASDVGALPVPAEAGTPGQVYTKTAEGEAWDYLDASDVGAVSLDGLELVTLEDGEIPAPGKVYAFAPTEAVEMDFPAPVEGFSNAFRLRITMPDPAVAVTWPAGLVWRFAIPTLAAGTTSELAFAWTGSAWEGWAVPDMAEYAQLSAANTFSASQTINNNLTVNGVLSILRVGTGYSATINMGTQTSYFMIISGDGQRVGFGYSAAASGNFGSLAVGYQASATGGYGCLAVGQGVTNAAKYSATIGKYNVSADAPLVIGNGTGATDRKNIVVIDWSGNMTLAGDLTFTPTGKAATTLTALEARIAALEQAQN